MRCRSSRTIECPAPGHHIIALPPYTKMRGLETPAHPRISCMPSFNDLADQPQAFEHPGCRCQGARRTPTPYSPTCHSILSV